MWVFDGEEWTQEDANETGARPETTSPRFDEFEREMQVIEIVPVPQTNRVPPFPLP